MSQMTLSGKTIEQQEEERKRGKEIKINIPNQEKIIYLNDVKIKVKFKSDFLGNTQKFYEGLHYVPHIEIQSFNDKPNILTEGGYRSCFFDFWFLREAKDFKELVEKVLKNEFEYIWKDKGKRALKNKPYFNIKWNN